MTLRSLRAHWPLAAAVGLLALLGVLGWLQYHWVGQVSAAERERIEARMRSGVAQFADELDRELGRAYLALQAPPSVFAEEGPNVYGRQYEVWRATAQYPRLVRDVYVGAVEKSGGLTIRRYDPESALLTEEEPWPEGLASVRAALVASADGEVPAPPRTSIHPEVPAIVAVAPELRVFVERGEQTVERAGTSVFTIIVLDRDYMTRELFPELTARYFPADATAAFRVAVLGEGSARVYSTDASFPGPDAATPDAEAPLLAIRVGEIENVIVTAEGPPRVRLGRRAPEFVPHKGKADRVIVMGERFGPGTMVFKRETSVGEPRLGFDGKWRLVVNHAAGSLDAAVAGARTRNLAVGLGILVVLGASMLLLAASTRRAQALARQQMEFVAGVSHELRTPLAVIRSAGENLAHGVVASAQQVRQYGALVESEGRRLSGMVEQVLQFAGNQSGRRRYETRPVDVGAAVGEAVAAFRHEVEENGIELEVDVEPGLPDGLADSAALRQAVENLLGNAIKYGRGARWVRVSARLAAGGGRPEVLVSVEDRGRGIARDEIDRIFEPFFRGRDVVADQIHGSGLGLSLVRHAADAHGWRVDVESEPGRGSRFTLRIPALAAGASEVERP